MRQCFHDYRSYSGTHEKVVGDLIFMNRHSKTGRPMQGAVSEVNVWDRILSSAEMRDLASCRKYLTGNVVDWETSLTELNGLLIQERNRSELCSSKDVVHISFPMKKNFDDTVTFCPKIGGKIAVATGDIKLTEMAEAYFASTVFEKQHSYRFYTGFRKLPDEGEWTSLDGNIIWNNWEASFPQNKAKSRAINCAISRKWNNWKFVDSTCTGYFLGITYV